MPSNTRILITGARGFVGKHCVAAALASGYRVRGTVRSATAADEVRSAVAKIVDVGDRLEFVTTDLLSDQGWDAAMAGCRFVLHVASPFPFVGPRHRDSFVPVAREGTLRVLKAAQAAGVERSVVTSSTVAVYVGHPDDRGRMFKESDWTDVGTGRISPYALSKTLAERAAWDFIGSSSASMSLVAVNPGLVLGPSLDRFVATSGEIVRHYLAGKFPAAPPLTTPVADVRDVAAAHIAAIETKRAAGQRFICAGGSLSLLEIGRILGDQFPEFRRRMPKIELPMFVARLVALANPGLQNALLDIGGRRFVASDNARTVLGIRFRPAEEAVIAMAHSLIEHGRIKPGGEPRGA